MGFKAREILPLPTKDGILEVLMPESIFSYYLKGLPKQAINSPLREDKNASFSLFQSDIAGVLYKDFATGEMGDCFVFVKRLFNLSNLNEVYNRIALDFGLTQFELPGIHPTKYNFSIIPKPRIEKKLTRQKVTIGVKRTIWNGTNSKFWIDYGVSRDQLIKGRVYPISHYFINGAVFKADSVAFAYVEYKDGIETIKIYQPYNQFGKKWINNNDFSTWELWEQLPVNGYRCIITSSRKDAMVIKSMFGQTDITSCSLQSEGVNPKPNVVQELKDRFKEVYVLYDNDFTNKNNPGRTAGAKLAKQFNLTQIEIDSKYVLKDISDFRYANGRLKTKQLLLNLILNSK